MDLSLCMIVKNEESRLPQTLKSVKGIVDEMVVLDTGSTDRTVEIAREFGARVIILSGAMISLLPGTKR